MAANRGHSKGQRNSRQRIRAAEEVECGDVESTSKQSKLALQKAFHDVSKKYSKVQEDYERVVQENMKLQAEIAVLIRENEFVKLNLEKGFQAFNDKFKETEQLKKELDLKEKENADKVAESSNVQHTGMIRETEEAAAFSSCPENIETAVLQPKTQITSISTQTEEEKADEEKTDEVVTSPANFTDLLKSCGFEIVMQDNKTFLILINRDNFKLWLENATDGKITVDFEKTQVCERFVQTVTADEYRLPCDHEALIIQLKSKLADQADAIEKYRQMLSQMEHIKKTAPLHAESNQTLKRRCEVLVKYHLSLLFSSRKVVNQMNVLNQQLVFQQRYIKHLVNVIRDSKDVPKQLKLLSEVAHVGKLKTEKQREIKKPPTLSVAVHAEESEEEKSPEDDELIDDDANGLFSIAVQETDNYPYYVASTGNESSASVVTLPESRTSSIRKSDSQLSRGKGLASSSTEAKNTVPSMTPTNDVEEEPQPTTEQKSTDYEQQEATGNDDDIVVINEDDVAAEGAAGIAIGAKQCPVCYIAFSPSSSQSEFESHVLAHFQD